VPEPKLPDKRAVRRSFERAAAGYDRAAFLQREVGMRLVAHLDPIRIDPASIVDLGCGTGAMRDALVARYPQATWIGVDFALPMLAQARQRTPWWRRALGARAPLAIGADIERLALAGGCADFAFSNLTLQWCEPQAVFRETARVLRAGGLFLFSTFGPDTLKELRQAFAGLDAHDHVNAFVDMHDLGDALVAAGFADPVMEMETLTLEYASVEAVARDLKAIGAHNALANRPRGLSGRQRWTRMAERYERLRRDGALPATYEVIYGHAWKTRPRHAVDGRQVIEFQPRRMP